MAWGRRKSGPKSAEKQPLCPHLCSFSLPLSLRGSSHQPGPPQASPPLAPPQVAIPTTSRPPPRLKQPLFLPLSHFCRSLHLLPVDDSGHRSSQKRRQNHQLSLLITAETPASCEPLLRQPPFSAAISVACRTWTIVHVLQIINIAYGPGQCWPAHVSGLGPARPKKLKKKIFWVDIAQPFWADVGPPILGLSSAQLSGPARPICF
jgi:hypothetical protein